MAKPFTLIIDASRKEVLTQDGKVITYEGRKRNEAERRYPIFDQELWAIKIWKNYLKNNDFEVMSHYHPFHQNRGGLKAILRGNDI